MALGLPAQIAANRSRRCHRSDALDVVVGNAVVEVVFETTGPARLLRFRRRGFAPRSLQPGSHSGRKLAVVLCEYRKRNGRLPCCKLRHLRARHETDPLDDRRVIGFVGEFRRRFLPGTNEADYR